jgi:hypothetical protein
MTVAPVVTETIYALAAANLGPFATVWPYAEDADVDVYVDIGAGFVQQFSGVGFVLADVPPTLTNGGTITLNAALLVAGAWPAGSKVAIVRSTSEGQPSAFGELAFFSPQASEAALDNVSRQLQEIGQALRRVLSLPYSEAGFTLPDAALRLGMALTFDPVTGLPTLSPLPQAFTPYPVLTAPPPAPGAWQIYIDTALGPRIWGPDNAWHNFLVA